MEYRWNLVRVNRLLAFAGSATRPIYMQISVFSAINRPRSRLVFRAPKLERKGGGGMGRTSELGIPAPHPMCIKAT